MRAAIDSTTFSTQSAAKKPANDERGTVLTAAGVHGVTDPYPDFDQPGGPECEGAVISPDGGPLSYYPPRLRVLRHSAQCHYKSKATPCPIVQASDGVKVMVLPEMD